MKKDFLVLTSTLGNKDMLVNPHTKYDSCDYIAVVDSPFDADSWTQYKNYEFSSIDEYKHRRNAKLYKVLSSLLFSEYKYIIWHDANHQLITDPASIIEEYGEHDLYLLKHPLRDCAYDEMKVVSGHLDNKDIVNQQSSYYISAGFPTNYGLFAMGNFIKRVNTKTTILGLKWWEQICRFSSRDQCSFTFCLWDMQRSGESIDHVVLQGPPENILRENKYFNNLGTRLR